MNQLVLALVSISFVAHMSDCYVVKRDLPAAFAEARAVFIGEVKAITKPLSSDPAAPLADRLFRVSFKVDYSWKGAGFQEYGAPGIVVLSDQEGGSCFSGGSFTEGRKYLVYATETIRKDLIVGPGNRTTLLSLASEDLKELQKISSPFYRFRVKPMTPTKPLRAEQTPRAR
jgi:hypothetical protein